MKKTTHSKQWGGEIEVFTCQTTKKYRGEKTIGVKKQIWRFGQNTKKPAKNPKICKNPAKTGQIRQKRICRKIIN